MSDQQHEEEYQKRYNGESCQLSSSQRLTGYSFAGTM